MTAKILPQAEEELEAAFRYYESERRGLGIEMLDEFRGGIERILYYPDAWPPLDGTYRRYRLNRFPYGIIYRRDRKADEILILAFMHLSRKPGSWHGRDIPES